MPNQRLQSRVHQLSYYVGPSLYRPVMPQVRPRRVCNQSHSLNGHLGIQVLHTMRHHRSSPSVAQVRCTAVCTVRRHVAHKVGHHRSPHLAATMLRQVTPHVAGYLWTRVVPHAAEQAAIHLAPRVVHTLLRKVAAHVSDRVAASPCCRRSGGQCVSRSGASCAARIHGRNASHGGRRSGSTFSLVAASPARKPTGTRSARRHGWIISAMDETGKPAGEWGSSNRQARRDPAGSDGRGSPLSAHRYARRARPTPRVVAERLHFLAEVLNHPAGSHDHGRRPSLVLRVSQCPSAD